MIEGGAPASSIAQDVPSWRLGSAVILDSGMPWRAQDFAKGGGHLMKGQVRDMPFRSALQRGNKNGWMAWLVKAVVPVALEGHSYQPVQS